MTPWFGGSAVLTLAVEHLLAVQGERPAPDGRATLVKVIDVLNRGGLQLTRAIGPGPELPTGALRFIAGPQDAIGEIRQVRRAGAGTDSRAE